ncbi:hypothetical protein AO366_0535 [Moraxella catarrhalis]|nr:hypothetical protein AO368_1934 [Moraxella catarrhalis]OAV35109.1 hypothetical protein AO366_0535 [Moraxella catarrhalis]
MSGWISQAMCYTTLKISAFLAGSLGSRAGVGCLSSRSSMMAND